MAATEEAVRDETDPRIPFRVSHAVAIAGTVVKVDLLWKLGLVAVGTMTTLGAAILTVLLMKG